MIIANDIYVSSDLLRNQTFDLKSLPNDCIELIRFSEITTLPYKVNVQSEDSSHAYFAILFDLEPTGENLLLLARATFSTKFSKQDGKVNIFLKGLKSQNKIEEYLLNQGYSEVNVFDIDQMIPFKIGYLSGLIESNKSIVLLIGSSVSEHNLNLDVNSIKNALTLFSASSALIEQNKLLTKENGALIKQNKEFVFDLNNQKKYLEIALRQKETERILNFYHKEYEVLPLWYKRVGHVLKAIMGKRNFTSLFKN